VLQCVAVYYNVLQCVAVYYSVLQCVALCGCVLQCVAVCVKNNKMLTEKLGIREIGEVWWCGRQGHDDVVKSWSTFVRLEDLIACIA